MAKSNGRKSTSSSSASASTKPAAAAKAPRKGKAAIAVTPPTQTVPPPVAEETPAVAAPAPEPAPVAEPAPSPAIAAVVAEPAAPAKTSRKKTKATEKAVEAAPPAPAKSPVKIALEATDAKEPSPAAPRLRSRKGAIAEPDVPMPIVAPGEIIPPKKIVFITSECTPLAQTGGLGDVVAGLSKALLKRGHDVRIIMPLYSKIDRYRYGINFSHACCVHFGRGEELWVGVHTGKLDGEVPIWFVDYARYFERPWIYDGSDEDAWRFGLLSKAALQICKDASFIPDVAHVHDWMTSPVSVFLKTWDNILSPLSNTASVLTIHNIGYQGKFHPSVLDFYGFGGDYHTPDKFEDFGAINLLKAGIQYSDAITTVSPTYAREIRGPIGGMGLADFLNARGENVFGILNGVDTELWNPETDKFLPARYSRGNMAGKAECKRALQEKFGLRVDPKIPIFGIISRFAPQKGFDLIAGALPQALRDMIIQVVVLGSGDPHTENFFRWLSGAHGGAANAHIGFAPDVAHLIEAGSDFFIMPSIYEPCGLNQMYSSLYGTLPIVRATGGLDDTVDNYDEYNKTGTGFKFWEISDRALYYTIGWAVSTWYDRPDDYRRMQQLGMSRDFTWANSARQYERVYDHAIARRLAR